MNSVNFTSSRQQGATLIVAVIVLVLLTMTVISAFRISKSHTQAVANMQFRDEALAAANSVLEEIISGKNFASQSASVWPVDTNHDGVNDLQVAVEKPRCIRVEQSGANADENLSGIESTIANTGESYILWEVQANVSDTATGASVSVVQGFRQPLTSIPSSCN